MLPKKLKTGDTIGVFSPSSPATVTAKNRYIRAKQYLIQKGFKVLEGNLTGKQDFYRSGSILQRVDELNALIRNPEVTCIMAAIGGMNSNSLLPYIDYEAIKQSPKIIVGYRSKKPHSNQLITIQKGTAIGRLIGGNLNTMQGIWNTEYMPVIKKGDILFIEYSLKIDRKPYEILQEVMGDVSFPVLAQFDCCHTHPMLTMPIGCIVELDADRQKVSITSRFVGE